MRSASASFAAFASAAEITGAGAVAFFAAPGLAPALLLVLLLPPAAVGAPRPAPVEEDAGAAPVELPALALLLAAPLGFFALSCTFWSCSTVPDVGDRC